MLQKCSFVFLDFVAVIKCICKYSEHPNHVCKHNIKYTIKCSPNLILCLNVLANCSNCSKSVISSVLGSVLDFLN